jgi:Holliday junction resolvase-like predicted endonuclease
MVLQETQPAVQFPPVFPASLSAVFSGRLDAGENDYYHGRGNYHGHVNYLGHVTRSMRQPDRPQVERIAADVLRREGWKIEREPQHQRHGVDLAIQRGGKSYLVEVKRLSEVRSDRALPLLAQAILQAQAAAAVDAHHREPMAILAADQLKPSLVRAIEEFANHYAPAAAVGLIDRDGLRFLMGPGLQLVKRPHPVNSANARVPAEPQASQLFSDLNQWMLKVLLAPRIPEQLLAAPRGEYANATQLSSAAKVSVMTAFRFLRQLAAEGFLDESSSVLNLVRVEQLLQRWLGANSRLVRERPMRWTLAGDPARQLYDALRRFAPGAPAKSRRSGALPRACIGLFAAADALGLGLVRGIVPQVYLERSDADVLKQLGMSPAERGLPPDVIVRRPVARESVFRAAVEQDGILVSDVLQTWLDVSAHPSRGDEQAEAIYRRVLRPMLKREAP